MATKRNKTQAKRNQNSRRGLPGWGWLVIGIALTAGAFFFVPRLLNGNGSDSFFRPHPNADAQPPAVDTSGTDNEPIVAEDGAATAISGHKPPAAQEASGKATAGKEQDYAFYTLLPGEETPISDAELAARTRAEEATAARAAARAAAHTAAQSAASPDAATPATSTTLPKPPAACARWRRSRAG